jgi:hypothetical protein
MIERVFNYARAKKLYSGDNPATWKGLHEYRWPKPSDDENHHAALPYAHMPEFMKALRQKQESSTAAIALEFLILTAARTDEVNGMLWEEIDWENQLWVLPRERTKQNREHTVERSGDGNLGAAKAEPRWLGPRVHLLRSEGEVIPHKHEYDLTKYGYQGKGHGSRLPIDVPRLGWQRN